MGAGGVVGAFGFCGETLLPFGARRIGHDNVYLPSLFTYEALSCLNTDDPPGDCPTLEFSAPVNFGQPTQQQITSADTNSQKTIKTAYKWQQSTSTFLSSNFLAYRYTMETDSAPGAEAGKTTYGYDSRADITSISQDVTAGSPIVTQSATYNPEGMPSTTTDGCRSWVVPAEIQAIRYRRRRSVRRFPHSD